MYHNDQAQNHQQECDDQLQSLYHKDCGSGAVGFHQGDGTLNQCGESNT